MSLPSDSRRFLIKEGIVFRNRVFVSQLYVSYMRDNTVHQRRFAVSILFGRPHLRKVKDRSRKTVLLYIGKNIRYLYIHIFDKNTLFLLSFDKAK